MAHQPNDNHDALAGNGPKSPMLSPSGMAKLREIFGQAVEVFGPEREALIRDRLGDAARPDTSDPEANAIRAQLRSLLAAHEDSAMFLSEPAIGMQTRAAMAELVDREASADAHPSNAKPDDRDAADPLIGATLGDYAIQSVLGAGGMGVVYLARQRHPQREVALKVIRWVFASKSLLRRFEHEARALARLQHPGIAQIYEAGSAAMPDGRSVPFFAMELVRGDTITHFASDAKLSTRDRLAIFADLCDAVHHAHQKGVIHRDLKPANILVDASSTRDTDTSTRSGPRVQPKILDFGVARLAEDETGVQTAHTSVTQAGQVLGTLPYMSPEQLAGDAADTRVDVYALGVILYELLTGKLPRDLTGMNLAAAAVAVRSGAPSPPSKHDATLKGDIETITLKAIASEAVHRYQSAGALAADVRAYLADLPIAARPATTMYHFRTFARRNRAVVVGAAAVFVALVLGVAGTGVGLYRANHALLLAEQRRQEAQVNAKTAERSEKFLTSVLTAANPLVAKNRDLTVRELLDEAALRLDAELSGEPAIALRSRLALAKTYLSIAAFDQALAQTDLAESLAIKMFGQESVEHSLVMAQRCEYFQIRSMIAEAIPVARRCLDVRLRALSPDDVLIARAEYALGRMLVVTAKYGEGIAHLRRALGIIEQAGGTDPILYATELASALRRTRNAADREEAARLLEDNLVKVRAMGGQGYAVASHVLSNLSEISVMRREYGKAVEQLRETVELRESVFPKEHPNVLYAKMQLARVLRLNGEVSEARSLIEDLREPVERVMGKDAPLMGDVHGQRAEICLQTGDMDCALEAARAGVALQSEKTPFVFRIVTMTTLEEVHLARKEWSEAIVVCDQMLAMAAERNVPATTMHVTATHRVRALIGARRFDEALAATQAMLESLGTDEPTRDARLETTTLRGEVLDGSGRHGEAQDLYRSIVREVEPIDQDWAAEVLEKLASSLQATGNNTGAAEARARAAELAKDKGAAN